VRVIVVVPCKVPEVAVTVTVEVLAVEADGVDVVDVAAPPPQPERRPSPAQTNAASIQGCQWNRFLHPKRQIVTARAVNGKKGLGPGFNADCALAEIVSWVVAAVPDGVTVAGANEHVAPVGNPEHTKLTGELKPFWGVTDSVTVPVAPESTVSEPGDAPRVKLGGEDRV
jgi:hypothetical protein